MKFVAALLLISFASSMSIASPDYRKCTRAVQDMTNKLFTVIVSFEEHPYNPCPVAIKNLLHSVQPVIGECAERAVDLTRFDRCTDLLVTVFPIVGRLVDAINRNDVTDITTLSLQVALTITNGAVQCVKDKETALYLEN